MTKYLLNRILRSLFSVIMVVGIVMVLIYSCLDKVAIFKDDPVFSKHKSNGKQVYMYQQWERYGYIDYVNYTEYLRDLLLNGEITQEIFDEAKTIGRYKDGSADSDVRTYHLAETGIGNLTADAMLDAAASDGAVVALMPDQSISGTLANGIVSKGQVQNLFDDQLYLVTCKMTGGDLRTALENSFNNYPNADGFLQVSGISYTFNASTAIGSRLSDIMIDGHKLDDARTYIVATTNILADTLGYRSEATGRVGTYRTIASVVTDYIQKNSSATSGSALPSETESDTEDTTASGETADTSRIQINE